MYTKLNLKTKRHIMCGNCGKLGHEIKYCLDGISSFGMINLRVDGNICEHLMIQEKFCTQKNSYFTVTSKKYPNIKLRVSDNFKLYADTTNNYKLEDICVLNQTNDQFKRFCYYKDKILFMMVSRRFSLGFIEFIRGKYDVSDTKMIINLFEQMTADDINLIRTSTYDDLLYLFINRHNETKEVVLNNIYEGKYSNEYCEAKIKFNILRESDDIPWNLSFYTKYIKPKWKEPEWGFPKGRRDNLSEENLSCACREFEEETGLTNKDYVVLNKIEPIVETLVGTNGIPYKHIYYLSINESTEANNDLFTNYDTHEIGEIKWFTYTEAMNHIRPYHHNKKKILTHIYLFIMNYLINNFMDHLIDL